MPKGTFAAPPLFAPSFHRLHSNSASPFEQGKIVFVFTKKGKYPSCDSPNRQAAAELTRGQLISSFVLSLPAPTSRFSVFYCSESLQANKDILVTNCSQHKDKDLAVADNVFQEVFVTPLPLP